MAVSEWLQIILFGVLLVCCTPLLGGYMARVYSGERTLLSPLLRPVENFLHRLAGIRESAEQTWQEYTASLLTFHLVGFALFFFLLLAQGFLPLNPAGAQGLEWSQAFNVATSFVTNTNWQSYGGEIALSHLTQMLGPAVQNFASAAVGMAVLAALIRGIKRHSANTLGNFWVDLLRGVLYILLPLSLILALALVSQGVIQNFSAPVSAATLGGADQLLPQGPAASQVAIKQLGTNGGGFFNTNSAHPYENPTPLSNFLEILAILLIPAALTNTYGRMVGSQRQGWAIFAAMSILFSLFLGGMLAAETAANPVLGGAAMLEGKEVRFGIANSVLWGAATTAASNGSVNAMLSSFSPLAGGLAMLNIMLGEVIFGGVGAGLYGMLLFVLATVFLAGLMIGRTPEYLGKKLEAREVRLLVATLLVMPVGVLALAALGVSLPGAAASIGNPGPHGLSQILYAYTSGTGNNGSAFAGFGAGTTYHNLMIALAMLLGRFGFILPVLAIAGSLAAKQRAPVDANSFPTHGPLFVILLTVVILLVGGLTFLPALVLGPIAEHFVLLQGF